jgi:hypothetical protein
LPRRYACEPYTIRRNLSVSGVGDPSAPVVRNARSPEADRPSSYCRLVRVTVTTAHHAEASGTKTSLLWRPLSGFTKIALVDGTAAHKGAPARFGLEFIGWLKEATESHWRTYVPRDLSAGSVAGLDWQTGTQWRGGMSRADIGAAESQFGISFPPDYRLFLNTLHTPDPPLVGAVYEGDKLVRTTGRILPDWTGDPTTIDGLLEWAVEAFLESSYRKQKYNWMSRADWFAANRRNLASGPTYIPVIGHSYLVCWGARMRGMPTIRFDESDVIIRDSWSLRECLMEELFVPPVSHAASADADTT